MTLTHALAGRVTLRGRLRIAGAKTVALRTQRRTSRGGPLTVSLPVARRVRERIARSLRRGQKVRLSVDAALATPGGATSARRTLTVAR